jgi:hypothetical protein
MIGMMVEALSAHTGTRLAEVGFLLLALTGVWMVVAFPLRHLRPIVAGVVLAVSGVLLLIATHWGHFG